MKNFSSLDQPLTGAVLLWSISLFLPVGKILSNNLFWIDIIPVLIVVLISLSIALLQIFMRGSNLPMAFLVTIGVFLGAAAPLMIIDGQIVHGYDATGLWIYIIGLGLYAWRAMEMMSSLVKNYKGLSLIVPILFGCWLLYLWQVVTTGFDVPSVLLPSPVMIGAAFVGSLDILVGDFYQTFVKSVLSGFVIGCGSGFIVAIIVDKIPFMQRGLLPLGSLVSAIPIVGIAPIMVMWFGFDWQSKAAVIVVMTFFPMLVNTLAGLEATSRLEKDLMRSYAASYFQTLLFVRLPNALPFIFNALKINSTLALIGAIVAEFFGTPIVGMGFRISTEVGRMNVDVVWATIAVAALAGSLFYGILALMERSLTFWHPSYRSSRH